MWCPRKAFANVYCVQRRCHGNNSEMFTLRCLQRSMLFSVQTSLLHPSSLSRCNRAASIIRNRSHFARDARIDTSSNNICFNKWPIDWQSALICDSIHVIQPTQRPHMTTRSTAAAAGRPSVCTLHYETDSRHFSARRINWQLRMNMSRTNVCGALANECPWMYIWRWLWSRLSQYSNLQWQV